MPALGVRVRIERVDAAELTLTYEGPPKPRRSLEMLLRSDYPNLERVTFVDAAGQEIVAAPATPPPPPAIAHITPTAMPTAYADSAASATRIIVVHHL